MTQINEVDGLTAADVMHGHVSTLPATATVGEVRAYFDASASRRLAVIVDGARYVGSIGVGDLPADADALALAADSAMRQPMIDPAASAAAARDMALGRPSRRLPVVDGAGDLVGIVAIDKRLERFCGA